MFKHPDIFSLKAETDISELVPPDNLHAWTARFSLFLPGFVTKSTVYIKSINETKYGIDATFCIIKYFQYIL